jgi:hypothetical protein
LSTIRYYLSLQGKEAHQSNPPASLPFPPRTVLPFVVSPTGIDFLSVQPHQNNFLCPTLLSLRPSHELLAFNSPPNTFTRCPSIHTPFYLWFSILYPPLTAIDHLSTKLARPPSIERARKHRTPDISITYTPLQQVKDLEHALTLKETCVIVSQACGGLFSLTVRPGLLDSLDHITLLDSYIDLFVFFFSRSIYISTGAY